MSVVSVGALSLMIRGRQAAALLILTTVLPLVMILVHSGTVDAEVGTPGRIGVSFYFLTPQRRSLAETLYLPSVITICAVTIGTLGVLATKAAEMSREWKTLLVLVLMAT